MNENRINFAFQSSVKSTAILGIPQIVILLNTIMQYKLHVNTLIHTDSENMNSSSKMSTRDQAATKTYPKIVLF